MCVIYNKKGSVRVCVCIKGTLGPFDYQRETCTHTQAFLKFPESGCR